MTAFVTEVQLGARGQGFAAEEIREQERLVAEARRAVVSATEALKQFGPVNVKSDHMDGVRRALLSEENRLALMHLHNRLRALERR